MSTTTPPFSRLIPTLVILLFTSVSFAQIDITAQGFDSSPTDTWAYATTLNTGTIGTTNTRFSSASRSLRLGGSSSSGSGSSNNDPYVLFNNQSLLGFMNVQLSIDFSCDGSADDRDDLYLDISYNNGLTYTSIKLIDGRNGSPDDLPFSHAVVGGISVGSTYNYNISNLNTQVKVRIRFDEEDNQANTTDYYYIDDIKLTGVPVGFYMDVFGLGNPINHNSTASTVNDTDFGITQIVTSPITHTFIIKNSGTGTINLTGFPKVSISGNPGFSVTAMPSSPIASLNTTAFQIQFNPTTVGQKIATVSIASNDTDENPYVFQIKGAGTDVFCDSDSDGVYDNVDIDDDNDGIRDTMEEANCTNCSGNKVNCMFLNETFGTGTIKTTINTTYNVTTTYCYEDGIASANTPACPTMSSWILDDGEYCVDNKITGTLASDPENIHGNLAWYNGEDHTPGDVDGRMAIFNASYAPGTFYQTTISGIMPNVPIIYSFWVLNIMAQSTFPGSILPNVTVEFLDLSNNLLSTFSTGDIGRCPGSTTDNTCAQGQWEQFSTSVNLGSANTFIVRFKNNAPGGNGNDLAIDDIRISQALCDLDNDGVADIFDLDSDNDGIEDIIEVGLGNLTNGKGRVDVTFKDVNGNGLHDAAESLLAALDNDGDGVPNYIDLDSDNDSLFDVDESGAGNINAAVGYNNGDGDINGDGVGDGIDSETFQVKDNDGDGIYEGSGDGILDIYDYGIGLYGNLNQGSIIPPFLNYVLDTDGDGIPNYIDTSSNGAAYDIAGSLYAALDANNNGRIDGTVDADKDGILDTFDTKTNGFGSPRDLNRKLFLEFDGRNDYGQSTAILGGLGSATLMAWVNMSSAFTTDGVIVGQDKYQIRITSAKRLEVFVNGTTLTYNPPLNTRQWYHVAAVFGGGSLKLYLNGSLVKSQAVAGPINADTSLLTIGKNPVSLTKYFKGKIDEIRIFNVALTDTQLQRMVYQEIQNTASQVRGAIVPKDIGSLPYANLLRYYRMDAYKDDIIDDLTTVGIDVGTGMKIYNNKNIYVQQAPMPFITERSGDFATAVDSPTKEIRGLDIMDFDWSIVNVKHNITETSNCTDLGMIVDPGTTIVVNNDSKLQNDWYLKLDGKIDLQGRSQLVQTSQSDLDPSSAGSLERDQQGTKNIYNYNYWSSPVGPINASTNNNNYNVSGVFKDGTNPANPVNINWIGGYDGVSGTPINLARYWIYKFQNVSNTYANWTQIQETGTLAPSQGFTLKGSGSASADQNYTFIGKPFNGTITNPIAANNLNLSGNPYPCALDANVFISDNSSSLNGTLYFWEHYTTNNSHNLAAYQGGYATRNLTGGTAPVAPALISGLGSSTRIPGRYIPVGQGFFVQANATGGNITFNNSQRAFVKENNASSNIMFKNGDLANADDLYEEDHNAKIRLGYTTQNNFHRQVLLGFMNEKATSDLDFGYDALEFDQYNNDMSFMHGTNKLIIQGDGYFNVNNIYPIVVKADIAGTVKFMLDDLENFEPKQEIYIYDAETNTYHDIRNEMFEVEIPVGENNTRFSLRFTDHALSTTQNTVNEIKVTHTQNDNLLTINNQLLDVTVQKVVLYSILGKPLKTWNITNENQQAISIPIQNVTTGTYIAKVETNNGSFNKKIIIN